MSEKRGTNGKTAKVQMYLFESKVTEFSAKGASEQNCVNLTLNEYEVMRLLDL